MRVCSRYRLNRILDTISDGLLPCSAIAVAVFAVWLLFHFDDVINWIVRQ
jgi:hypothetical protein